MSTVFEKVGEAVDITRRDWVGLPWDLDPNQAGDADWHPVYPGTYYLDRVDDRWVYIRLGGVMVKVDRGDFEAYWPSV